MQVTLQGVGAVHAARAMVEKALDINPNYEDARRVAFLISSFESCSGARGHGGARGRHAEDTARGARASRGAGRTGTGKAAAGSAARGRTGDEGRGADRAEKERLAHEMAALLLEEEERASRLPQAQAGIGTVKGGRGGGKRGGNPAPSRHAARVVRAKKKDRANGKA